MHLDLSDEETAALTRELHDIVESDRYPFSPHIRTLRAILAKLRPEPVREPLPPRKVIRRHASSEADDTVVKTTGATMADCCPVA
jgi:hypothetical protein